MSLPKIKILFIALVLTSCTAFPNGNYVITSYDSDGKIVKEYVTNGYEQGPDGITFLGENGETVNVSGSFRIDKLKLKY